MIKHAFIGFAISLVCMLTPLIHFVTFPLGPVIGGWIAGSKHKAQPDQALGIGVLMGLFMVVPVGAILVLDKLAPSLNSWVDSGILTVLGIVVLVYTTMLGSMGAMIGGYMVGRSPNKEESSTETTESE
jgi:hypothetical protein